MSYPVLDVNDATLVGSYCMANDQPNTLAFNGEAANEANSLCPNLTGDGAIIQLSGVKGATVTVNKVITKQEKGGVAFAHYTGNPWSDVRNYQLSATSGTVGVGLWSRVTLVDKSLVTDGILDFTYDISAAYQ
ncbi:hypothetical protein KIH87_05790 [Paraneptunicella aestuarii]|uniref:hypothetical protein n=1 Tax=Paraneptunicella aestuarii TaxID=2831148 RepID=UPI001E406971|nr:hypothetical protein [Paraneptunicella aestuarii]UAA39865.1 hypothetical protein KIH87_05790 [Paraneptunicella aestuarii]